MALKNSFIMENINFFALFKIFIFTFLTWIYHTYNNVGITHKSLENKYEHEKALRIKFSRLLAKHVPKKNLYNTKLKTNLSDVRGIHKIKYLTEDVSPYPQSQKSVFRNLEDDISTYSKLKKRDLNNLDLYKNDYKHRYAKKNFFGKMDCYCEKKIFEKFDHINELAEKYQNNQKRFKKFFFKKYGVGLIFFMLLPFLGIIIPTYLYETYLKHNFVPCTTGYMHPQKLDADRYKKFKDFHITNEIDLKTWELMTFCNKALVYVLTISVIIVIFYILIKVVKYERLKAGKGKMYVKEYCRFCKDAFNNKIS